MEAQSNSQKSEHLESQKPRPETVFGDKRPIQSLLGNTCRKPSLYLAWLQLSLGGGSQGLEATPLRCHPGLSEATGPSETSLLEATRGISEDPGGL